jgi:hypothetical protein
VPKTADPLIARAHRTRGLEVGIEAKIAAGVLDPIASGVSHQVIPERREALGRRLRAIDICELRRRGPRPIRRAGLEHQVRDQGNAISLGHGFWNHHAAAGQILFRSREPRGESLGRPLKASLLQCRGELEARFLAYLPSKHTKQTGPNQVE